MKTNLTNCLFFLLSLTSSQLLTAQSGTVSFTSPSSFIATKPESISDLTYRIEDNKIFLNWTMAKNQDTNQFEIERSTDGKNFVLAALLFGTDDPGTEEYRFYEKARPKQTFYRIKIIGKDGTARYSDMILAKKNSHSKQLL